MSQQNLIPELFQDGYRETQNGLFRDFFGKIQANTTELFTLVSPGGSLQIKGLFSAASLGGVTLTQLGADPASSPLEIHTTQYYANGVACPKVLQRWRWASVSDGVPTTVAADASIGGFWTQVFLDHVNPLHMGAKGDFNFGTLVGTNDGPKVQQALDLAASLGLPCKLTMPHYSQQFDLVGPLGVGGEIHLPEGSIVIFEGDGAMVYDGWFVPCMYKQGPGKLTMIDPVFYYFGTINVATAAPYTIYPVIYNFINGVRAGAVAGVKPIGGLEPGGASLCILGGEIDIQRPKFICLTDTGTTADSMSFINVCMLMYDANDGTLLSGRILDFFCDGILFGVLGSHWSSMLITNMQSGRYGAYSTASGAGWDPGPPHLIYNTTPVSAPKLGTLTLLNPTDDGINLCAANWGANSLKFMGSKQVNVFGGYSKRPHGAVEGCCPGWNIIGYYGEMDYALVTAGANAIYPLRLLNNTFAVNAGRILDYSMRVTNTPTSIINGTSNVDGLKFTGTVSVDAMGASFALLGSGDWKNSLVEIDFKTDTTGTINTPVNLQNTSTNNTFKMKFRNISNFNSAQMRMIENDKANSSGNVAYFEEIGTGNTVTVEPSGLVVKRTTTTVALTATAGATLTAANIIPAGARLLGVTSVVTTALGATSGTTGYSVGLTVDPTRFGSIVGVAIGSGGSNNPVVTKAPLTDSSGGTVSNAIAAITAGAAYAQADLVAVKNAIASIASLLWQPSWFPTTTSLLVTAVGGNFDGTGVISLSVVYETTNQSTTTY